MPDLARPANAADPTDPGRRPGDQRRRGGRCFPPNCFEMERSVSEGGRGGAGGSQLSTPSFASSDPSRGCRRDSPIASAPADQTPDCLSSRLVPCHGGPCSGPRRSVSAFQPRPKQPTIRRYQRDHLGELIHIDKKLARIQVIGHRITGNRRQCAPGAGWEFVYVAVDDASRLAYAEVLANERSPTAVAFLRRLSLGTPATASESLTS